MPENTTTEYDAIVTYWKTAFEKLVENRMITGEEELKVIIGRLIDTMLEFQEAGEKTRSCRGSLCLTSSLDLESIIPLTKLGLKKKPAGTLYEFVDLSVDYLAAVEYNLEAQIELQNLACNKSQLMAVFAL